MTRSYRLGIQIVAGAILIAAVLSVVAARRYPAGLERAGQNLPIGAFPLGDFQLTDRTMRAVTQDDFRKHIWVVSFIFTRCPLSCPRITTVMKDLSNRLGGSDVMLASISVDPEFDTPPVLAAYAQRFGVPQGRWCFLTGRKQEVHELIQNRFKLGFQESSPSERSAGSELITHSDRLALVQDGHVVGFFESSDPASVAALMAQARRRALPGWVKKLPTVNASLNGTCAILLVLGWILIRQRGKAPQLETTSPAAARGSGALGRRFVRAHAVVMLTSVSVSALFLASYLVYHSQAGSVPYPFGGPSRVVYFTILLSHTALAIAVVPLVAFTLLHAIRRQYTKHLAIAQTTFPIWLYVAITGVVIYLMLYHLPTHLGTAQSII